MKTVGSALSVALLVVLAFYQAATGNGAWTEGGRQGWVRSLATGKDSCVRVFPEGPGIAPTVCEDPSAVRASNVAPVGDLGARGWGPCLTRDEIADLWTSHGGPASETRTAVAVALGESGGCPRAANLTNTNGTFDYGLWQINTIHRSEFERVTGEPWAAVILPGPATAYAVHLHRTRGSWRDWVAYTSGSYTRHLNHPY